MLRLFNHYVSRTVLYLGAAESAVLLLSACLYVALTSNGSGIPVTTGISVLDALVFFLVVVGAMTAMGLYDSALRASLNAVLTRVSLAFCVALVMMATLGVFYPQLVSPGNALWIPLLCSFIGIAAVRTLLPIVTDKLLTQRVLVVGAGTRATLLDRLRRKTDRRGIAIVGYVDTGDSPRAVADEKIVDARGDIVAFVRQQRIDEVVLAVGANSLPAKVQFALARHFGRAVRIIDVHAFFERQAGRVALDTAGAQTCCRAVACGDHVVKRVSDLILSTLLLIVAAPAMLLVALAISLESQGKGPILY
jgi:FlaA1/EpsC-like NDP-sugar epimerase